jgi:hypothetical protein
VLYAGGLVSTTDLRLLVLGAWAKPPDFAAWGALGVAVLLLLVTLLPFGPRTLGSLLDFASIDDFSRRRRFLAIASFASAFLSLGYVAMYLRGGPRGTDACELFLQARAMSHGHVAWGVSTPTASFRGGGLLFAGPDELAGVYPPGYPMLLAAAFMVGAPMVMGPVLAAAIAAATYMLTREIAAGRDDMQAEATARFAVGLSLVCAALRFHTADTLPQAATAVAMTVALASALRARRTDETVSFVIAGLLEGYVFACDPASAAALGAVLLAVAFGDRRRARSIAALLVAVVPGGLLLAAANAAASGSPFVAPARAYAALIGMHNAPFTARAAFVAFARALRTHATDVANFEPIALLVLAPLWLKSEAGRRARIALVLVVGDALVHVPILATVPSVAHATASAFAPLLPIEHAILAVAIASMLPRVPFPRRALAVLAFACAGFALHAVFEHRAYAALDGGQPRFDPDVLRESNVADGLLFMETDEGFDLAHVPDALPSHALLAARARGDDHDRLLYDLFGHPPVHRYIVAASSASATFWVPPAPLGGAGDETWRFEAESDWPPVSADGGFARVVDGTGTCLSDAHALEIVPATPTGHAVVTIELPLPKPEERKWRWSVVPRAYRRGGAGAAKLDVVDETGKILAAWSWTDDLTKPPTFPCLDLAPQTIELAPAHAGAKTGVARAWLRIDATGGSVALDKTSVKHGPS